METQQNPTQSENEIEVSPQDITDLRYATLVDFKALNGLKTDEEGNLIKMTMQHLADMIGVDRTTLYEWIKRPGFWGLVNARRKELSGGGRLTKVHETFYLKAVQGEWQFTNAYLFNFDPNYRTPTQKVELEAGDSLTEALSLARKRGHLIDAEVIDESDQNS